MIASSNSAGIGSLPHDLRENFFAKYLVFIQTEDELDSPSFAFPVMLLVLQFVNKTFNRLVKKENSLCRKVILDYKLRGSNRRNHSACLMMARAAREYGSITLLQWLENLGFVSFAQDSYIGAIEGGHIGLVEWLHFGGTRVADESCLGLALMRSNSAAVLRWAQQNLLTPPNVCSKENALTRTAVSAGNILSLEWVIDNGYWKWDCRDGDLLEFACSNCTRPIVEFLIEKFALTPHYFYLYLAAGSNLEVVKLLHEKYKFEFTADVMEFALLQLQFEVAMYIHMKSSTCKFPNNIASLAAQSCQLQLFQWCLSNGYLFDSKNDLNKRLLDSILGGKYRQKMEMLKCLYSLDSEQFCNVLPSSLWLHSALSVKYFQWFTSIGITIPQSCVMNLIQWSSRHALESIKYLVEEQKLLLPEETERFSLAYTYFDVHMYLLDHWIAEK